MPTKLVNKSHKREAAIPPLRILAEEDDMTLVTSAESGRNQAFEVLVGRYQRRILRVALRFARIREDAEDIMQQTFQKVFVHLNQFQGDSSLSTWMTRIAINEALVWLRRKRARPEVAIEDLGPMDETALPMDLPCPGPSPEESCLQRERRQILIAAMNELKPGTRTVIELQELGGFSIEETARAMGLSVSAVKGRAFHGRRRLRARLKHLVRPAWTPAREPPRMSRMVSAR